MLFRFVWLMRYFVNNCIDCLLTIENLDSYKLPKISVNILHLGKQQAVTAYQPTCSISVSLNSVQKLIVAFSTFHIWMQSKSLRLHLLMMLHWCQRSSNVNFSSTCWHFGFNVNLKKSKPYRDISFYLLLNPVIDWKQ